MKPPARRRLRVTLDGVAVGGDALAHTDAFGERRIVLVSGGVVGDELEVEVDPSKRPLRGKVLRVLTASPERREAPCAHAERCGGCSWMTLSRPAREAGYRAIIEATVGRARRAHEPSETGAAHTHTSSNSEGGYRTRARLAVHAAREVSVGFHVSESHRVVPITTCLALAPELAPVLAVLRELLQGARGTGEAHVALGRGAVPVLSLRFDGELPPVVFARVEQAVRANRLAGADIWLPGARSPARTGDPSVITVGGDGGELQVAAEGFAQASPALSLRLADHLAALLTTPLATLELYAGAGNLTVRLAGLSREPYEIVESDVAAVAACRRNLAARNLDHVKISPGDAANFPIAPRVRRVVLDPPRGGALAACKSIAASRVSEVAYISCDPATLARDLGELLAAGFVVRDLATFEMFPLTPHVETLVYLVRPRDGARLARGAKDEPS